MVAVIGVNRQTLIVRIDCRDRMMKLRLDDKVKHIFGQDGRRNSGIDLNGKAIMPKELSLCNPRRDIVYSKVRISEIHR